MQKKAGIATAAVKKQLQQMTLKGYIQRKETDGSLRVFATTSIQLANEKENDVYPYSFSVILAWERGLLYISPNAFCKAYGQVCYWYGELLGN